MKTHHDRHTHTRREGGTELSGDFNCRRGAQLEPALETWWVLLSWYGEETMEVRKGQLGIQAGKPLFSSFRRARVEQ